MNPKTLGNGRLDMLMACGSPGSALAYYSSQASLEPTMMRRNIPPDGGVNQITEAPLSNTSVQDESETSAIGMRTLTEWFSSAWLRLENWSWQRQQRAQEAYLARARDLVDLEGRMRELDGDSFLGRARALR